MQIVVSRKHSQHNAEQAMNMDALAAALVSPGGNTSVKAFTNQVKAAEFIAGQTQKGFVCHLFDLSTSYRNKTSLEIVTVNRPAPTLFAVAS